MSGGGGGGAPDQTEEERASAERGAREFNQAVEILSPVTDAMTKRLDRTAAQNERVGSQASLTAATEFDDTAVLEGAAGKGIAPGSGRAAMSVGDLSDAASTAVGKGVAAGEQEVDSKSVRGRMQLGKAGRGIADASSNLLTGIGQRKTQESIAKQKRELQQEAVTMGAIGSVAGAGAAKLEGDGGGSDGFEPFMKGASADMKGALKVTGELSGKLDSGS